MTLIEAGGAVSRDYAERIGLPTGQPVVSVNAVMRSAGLEEDHPFAKDPVGWAESHGIVLWSKQKEILRSMVDHRYTAVHSCHDAGKSYVAAVAVCWHLDVHPIGTAFAVTTAPSDKQVKAILWREIASLHSRLQLRGRITLEAQWYMGSEGKELVAYGRKPAGYKNADQAMQAFQGIHAKHVLVIMDEAAGIPEWLYDSADALATNEFARVLAIGNPDDPTSHFEKICRPGEGWNVIHIGAKHTPAFTGESVPRRLLHLLLSKTWVRERIKRWGKRSPRFISKVLGKFPLVGTDTLIPPWLVRKAWDIDLSGNAIDAPGQYGVDVARAGDDETCIYCNRGGWVRLRFATRDMIRTTETTGAVIAVLREDNVHINDLPVIVDEPGVGGGVIDGGMEQDLRVIPFNGGTRSSYPLKFINRNAEAWWNFKLLMEGGLVDLDPEDEDLASQLQSRKWWRDSAGRIHLETKEQMAKRGLPSPDRADAVIMSFVRAPEDDYEGSGLEDAETERDMNETVHDNYMGPQAEPVHHEQVEGEEFDSLQEKVMY